jgi:hypothetical protein
MRSYCLDKNFGQPKFFFSSNLLQFFNPHPPCESFINKSKNLKKIFGSKCFLIKSLNFSKNQKKVIVFIRKKEKKSHNKKKIEFFTKYNQYYFSYKNHKYLFKINSKKLFYQLNFLSFFFKNCSKIFFFEKLVNRWIFFLGNGFFSIKIKFTIMEKNFKKFLKIFL